MSLHYSALDHILSHENLAVRPFSKEVFWSLSFPGWPFGFVIYCPIKEKTSGASCHFGIQAQTHTPHSIVEKNGLINV